MAKRVRLFISAGPELEPEREAIGRALTEFPINLGWEIKRTPQPGHPVDLEAVQNCDVFVLLFASDIRAPVGWEWMMARQTRRPRWAFLRKDALLTPAGREFARELRGTWRPFHTAHELAGQLLEVLSAYILENWQEFDLSAQEWDTLSAYLARLRGQTPEEEVETPPAGAGDGGVILAPGRDLPRGGVIIEE